MNDIKNKVIIDVKNLKKYFPIRGGVLLRIKGFVKAVDGVSLNIRKGETLALVGESGCGKTTFGRTILGLIEPTDGKVLFEGVSIFEEDKNKIKELRKKMQIVFQNPYDSLHPRKLVKNIVGEPLKIHTNLSKLDILSKVKETLESVGLREEHMYRYPHEFSGGQRQRIAIARAIILEPEFIVLDEPTSALDVSVQSRILNLLIDLKERLSLTYLFITHNLAVVDYIANRVAVMYLGKIVEIGDKDVVFNNPLHPYTKVLMSSIPLPDPNRRKKKIIPQGEVPDPSNPPSGCGFNPRCDFVMDLCKNEVPPLLEIEEGHYVRCHLFSK